MNISRSLKIWILFAVGILTANAQNNDFEKVYNAFRQQTIKDYETFRDSVNVEYANFMRQVWKRYQVLPELPKPNEEPPVPPIIYSKED